MNRVINFMVTIVILATTLLLFQVYRSYVLQASILTEINSGSYNEGTLNKLTNINKQFPNITITSLPIQAIYGKYLFAFDRYSEALDATNKINFTDYSHFSSNLKAIIYNKLGVQDSALFYSKLAFSNLPGNVTHFEQYIRALYKNMDSDEIISAYKKTLFSKDEQFPTIFFPTVLALGVKNDSILNYLAKKAKVDYPSSDKVRMFADYVLYGEDNVKNAVQKSEEASILVSNKDYQSALELYKEAINLNPSDYTHYENSGICNYYLSDFNSAIPFFQKVIDSFNINNGKSEYFLGLSYNTIGKKDLACKTLYNSY